jgi:acyl-homoserine-lactone acylase
MRDDRFDYTRPVTVPTRHRVEGPAPARQPAQGRGAEIGWVMNTNNWPWTAAGNGTMRAADFPRYMDTAGENARGFHALMLLDGARDFTAERLMAAAYDSYLPAFATLIPKLAPTTTRFRRRTPARRAGGPIALLSGGIIAGLRPRSRPRSRDLGRHLVAGGRRSGRAAAAHRARYIDRIRRYAARGAGHGGGADDARLWQLAGCLGGGSIGSSGWTPDRTALRDSKPSVAVPFHSALGLARILRAKPYPNTKNYYGKSGNSFVRW